MNGSRREPIRDDVRRTPFATARTLPWARVSIVMMRSASPSLWVRRTIASSRYVGTVHCLPPVRPSERRWRRPSARPAVTSVLSRAP